MHRHESGADQLTQRVFVGSERRKEYIMGGDILKDHGNNNLLGVLSPDSVYYKLSFLGWISLSFQASDSVYTIGMIINFHDHCKA